MPRAAGALVQVADDRFLRFKQSAGVVEARSVEDVPDLIARSKRSRKRGSTPPLVSSRTEPARRSVSSWRILPRNCLLSGLDCSSQTASKTATACRRTGQHALTDLKPAVDFAQFEATLRRIKQHLSADGETSRID
jgi:hypothetical protein